MTQHQRRLHHTAGCRVCSPQNHQELMTSAAAAQLGGVKGTHIRLFDHYKDFPYTV